MKTKSKFTQEYVENFFRQNDCELLDEYTGCLNLLKYRCVCGNIAFIKFTNFKCGHRCETCRRKKQSLSQTLSPEYVKQFFIDNGCELLDNYEDSSKTMRYKCVCGKESTITWSRFKKGCRCVDCGLKKHSGDFHPKWIVDREEVVRRRRLRTRYRNMLHRTFDALDQKKSVKSEKLLGYTCKQLRDHIENHPNWAEISKGKWHIDHIFPIKAFLEHGIEDVSLINSLDNLRPMPAVDNWKKNDRYDVLSFCRWVEERGWFLFEGKFQKMSIVLIGDTCEFYIPSAKHNIVENKLHSYFVDRHNAYSLELQEIKGFWRNNRFSELLEEKHVKYICGINHIELPNFVGFLSEMCMLLQEQAIYVTMGHKSWLVMPRRNNEI